jgi:DNA-binding PadR family transcriptional regulator
MNARDDWDPSDDDRARRHRGGPWGQWGHPWGQFTGPSGPPPWLADLLGLAQPTPPSAPRGPRVRRGDVRVAILDVLRRAGERGESVNGYQVIQQIADLSGDEWRPSPGSVYPTISQLEDEGLVTSDDERGRRSLQLTTEGLVWTEEHREELDAVWAPFRRHHEPTPYAGAKDHDREESAGSRGADFKSEITQVLGAAWQLVTQGSETQRRAALEVLVATRRSLYGILADGRDPGSGQTRDEDRP